MKVKKTSEEITFLKKTTEFVLDVNGKSVRVYEHVTQDNETGDYEYDADIDEADRKALTEEEDEELNDYLSEILDLKDEEEFDTETK